MTARTLSARTSQCSTLLTQHFPRETDIQNKHHQGSQLFSVNAFGRAIVYPPTQKFEREKHFRMHPGNSPSNAFLLHCGVPIAPWVAA